MFFLGFAARAKRNHNQVRNCHTALKAIMQVPPTHSPMLHDADVPLFQQNLKGVQPIMTLTIAAITFAVVVSQQH